MRLRIRSIASHGTRDRKLRQRLRRLDDIDFVDEQAEAIASKNHSTGRTKIFIASH
jgi:hypothetical protein